MKRVLITGATGFVGAQLCEVLSRQGYLLRAALRADQALPAHVAEKTVVGEIDARTDWAAAIDGVDCVVHCAARAHILNDEPGNAANYMQTNAYGTERLAGACAAARIRRLILLSSVKVNGERNLNGAFTADDPPRPADAYAESKQYAEACLMNIAAGCEMEVAIVRPPLVYGPGVRANFLRLMNLVDRQVPLPLGAVNNSRSLVSVWNLCGLIERLLRDAIPKSAIFMVSDGEDLSTAELIRRIGSAMSRRTRLIPIPVPLLRVMSVLAGRRTEFERLCESLTVVISMTQAALEWIPPISVAEGLSRTARWYLSRPDNS